MGFVPKDSGQSIPILQQLIDFKTPNKMALLHLNINSLFNKIAEIDEILNLKLYDIVTLNETKLDEYVSQSFYKNVFYIIIRRDRGTGGGGVLVFIRKEYKILNSFNSLDFEMIHFKIYCVKTITLITTSAPTNLPLTRTWNF